MDWLLASKPKGCFNSQSGHMPGLWSGSPVGGVQEATTHWYFSLSLSPSLPLGLKINKIFFFKWCLFNFILHASHLGILSKCILIQQIWARDRGSTLYQVARCSCCCCYWSADHTLSCKDQQSSQIQFSLMTPQKCFRNCFCYFFNLVSNQISHIAIDCHLLLVF